jgi:hypothetical protein
MKEQNAIRLAQANTDPGFKIPGNEQKPANPPANPAGSAPTLSDTPPAQAGTPMEVAPVQGAPATDTSTRDVAVGGAIFLVLLIVFFFARNAYANHLVRRRVAPSSADTAGWLMFFGLAFLSGALVLAIINSSKVLSLAVTGTLLLAGVGALAGAFFTGRR